MKYRSFLIVPVAAVLMGSILVVIFTQFETKVVAPKWTLCAAAGGKWIIVQTVGICIKKEAIIEIK